MITSSQQWHYSHKGTQVGPVTADEIKHLIQAGTINQETKVWNGSGDWRLITQTELSCFFAPDPYTPPPLPSVDIDNRFVWAVVGVPILGAILEFALGADLTWLYIILNIGLCIADEKRLKAAGHKAPENWAVFLVPVYLWKRAAMLAQSKAYFWGWIVAFLISISISNTSYENMLAESAVPVVTEIIKEQLGGSAECKAVEIQEELTDGFYKATAILDNGNKINITIEDKDDEIYVSIPDQ